MTLNAFDYPDCYASFCMSQISEQQLNDAIAQAVENSKLKRDKSQWSINGKMFHNFIFSCL